MKSQNYARGRPSSTVGSDLHRLASRHADFGDLDSGQPLMIRKVLRKVRYLLTRLIHHGLRATWAVLLSPLTLTGRALATIGRIESAHRLVSRAHRRNPYTPGVGYQLMQLEAALGHRESAARLAGAWAREHGHWDQHTALAWSEQALQVKGWHPVISIAPPSATGGDLDLRGLPQAKDAWRRMRAAGTLWDVLADDLAKSLSAKPIRVIAGSDLLSQQLAKAFAEWAGCEVVNQ